eukprot:32609_1
MYVLILIVHFLVLVSTKRKNSKKCEVIYDLNRDLFPSEDFKISKAELQICHGNVRYIINGEGFPLAAPITLWQRHKDLTHPIFDYSLFVSPASRTTSTFNSGRKPITEPNVFRVNKYGNFRYEIELDYNALKPFETPLLNTFEPITQKSFCDIDKMPEYPHLCQKKYRESGAYAHIGLEFLREFDENGLQKLDKNGNAIVVRSPTVIDGLFVVVHIDLLSHGLNPGVFGDDNCVPDGFNCADRYVLAFIELPTIQQIERKKKKKKKKKKK